MAEDLEIRQCRQGHVSRRKLLGGGAAAAAWLAVGGAQRAAASTPVPGGFDAPEAHWNETSMPGNPGWYAPVDTARHTRTWMAWPARKDIWGSQLEAVRGDVAGIARTIAGFEPVAMIARSDQAAGAASACGSGVEIVQMTNDDLWMRDMGPVFVVNGKGGLAGVDLNFNGWGDKQVHYNDAKIAREVLALLDLPRFVAPFVSEGGALEFSGSGTVMATESSIINPNRNPGKSKRLLTKEICGYFGCQKMDWVPGLRGHDITDDHIDGLARFVGSAKIVVDQPADPTATDVWAVSERQALEILERSTNSAGKLLTCLVSRESATIPKGEKPKVFVNVYVNWYVCNGAVLIPKFGAPTSDADCYSLVSSLFPDRKVVQLTIDALAEGGGGIHCTTQQQPAV